MHWITFHSSLMGTVLADMDAIYSWIQNGLGACRLAQSCDNVPVGDNVVASSRNIVFSATLSIGF